MNLQQGYKSAFKTNLSGLSVKFSPFNAQIMAFASSDNFGIVGKGQLLILENQPNGQMKVLSTMQHKDAVFDCSWTEFNQNLIISACGDGAIQMWDASSQKIAFQLNDHKGEVQSVECSHLTPNLFISCGADLALRIWDIQKQNLNNSFPASHAGQIFKSVWHPTKPTIFASVANDGQLKIWDLNSQQKQVGMVQAHQTHIMSCDFNKYDELIATASADKTVKIWDLRQMQSPVRVLNGHRYPVRAVKNSPHNKNIIATASYDMNVNIWDLSDINQPLKMVHKSHTEFVTSIDFNMFIEKQIVSTSWDGRILCWNWDSNQPNIQ